METLREFSKRAAEAEKVVPTNFIRWAFPTTELRY